MHYTHPHSPNVAARHSPHSRNTPKVPWKVQLRRIVDENKQRHAVRNKMISVQTMQERTDMLFKFFELVRKLGYKLDNPANLREKHFKAVLDHWLSEGLSASTLQKRASIVRTFCVWVGKPHNMIKPLECYVDDKSRVQRKQVATKDKSWSSNGVDFYQVLNKIDAYDMCVGAQLRMIKAFGLRRQEAICFRPIVAMRLGEASHSITVEFGTKGGRPRSIPIDNDEKWEALAFACSISKTTNGHIGWEDLTLKQAIKRYSNVMAKFGVTKKDLGVTSHGLRHEYANDMLEQITRQTAPLRGGTISLLDQETVLLAKEKVTREMGHSRTSITSAYFGSIKTRDLKNSNS